ncbi:hypothetical protein NDA12_007591 [Ustilago hordei]|nr:hypothetical protein NDA15_006077 [Ustilago hordei]KAJ1594540.1 hypothetical protein NDA12_007591 [Ustilago hordei]
MADAHVLTPDQIAQLLSAQQQSSSSSSSSSSTQQHRLKTSFKKRRSFEPFYTGGATALTPDGSLLFSTLNEDVAVVEVSSGNLVQRIEGDTEEVTALTVTPSGSHLVIASRSLALRVFALPECRLVRSIPKSHLSQVNLMAVDPTGTLLATGGSDGVAKVWDIERGYCTHAFKGHAGVVSALAWNLAPASTCSITNGAGVGEKGKKPKSKNKSNRSNPESKMELLTGSVDGKLRIWDLNNPAQLDKPIATLARHDSVVRGISVSTDGMTLVSGSRDRTVVVWRLDPGKQGGGTGWKQVETLSADEGIESVGFLPPTSNLSQSVFWTGGSNGQIRLWDVTSSSIIAREPESFNDRLAQQARIARQPPSGRSESDADQEETRAITTVHYINREGERQASLVSIHADQNIVVRSLAKGDLLRKERQLIGFNDEIVDLSLLSSAGVDEVVSKETHLAVATNSRALRIYTFNESKDETTAELLAGHTDIVLCLDTCPDMRLLASGAKDRSVRIWAFVPACRLSKLSCFDHASADEVGSKLSRKSTTHVEDGEQGGEWVCVAICSGHAESVGALSFAPRPTSPGAAYAPFIATASQDRTVKLWDLSPLNALLCSDSIISTPLQLKSLLTQRVHEKDINCLDISPNNSLLATGSQDRTAKIFALSFTPAKPKSRRPASARLSNLATLKGHKRGIWALRFSPVDLALATASGDKTVRLWSLKTFTCVKLFEGHTNSVLKLSFLSHGMQLLSCAADGLVKLWNIKQEQCESTIDAHDDKVWSIALGKSEAWFISAAGDGSMKLWQDTTQEEKEDERKRREQEVRLEHEFGNMLQKRDWRNAIEVALRIGQPRRLLGLFSYVSANRPEAVAQSRNAVLASALEGESDDEDLVGLEEDGFEPAGIKSRRGGKKGVAKVNRVNATGENSADASSITGLASVDAIIATLPAPHLIQLVTYIRDWNTSTRTWPIAQSLLHCILSHHSAASLISIFTRSLKTHRAAIAQRFEDQQLGILAAKSDKERARETRLERERNVDLGTLVEGLLGYTERHYSRVDRLAVEASMLEYSLKAMDTLLGLGEHGEAEEEEEGVTFGEQLKMDIDSEEEEEEEEEEEDQEMSDASVPS